MPGAVIEPDAATRILRKHVDSELTVERIRPLEGGHLNTVVEWITDGSPGAIVAKISRKPDYFVLKTEYKALKHYKR